MKRSKLSAGYTIVEVMIFLAVSGAMIISANILLTGQQGKTDFAQSVRDFDSALQDISNDVSSGFPGYNFDTGDTCRFNASGQLTINPGAPETDSFKRCVFIGKVVQFTSKGYVLYPVIGRQSLSGGADVLSLADAGPQALAPGSPPHQDVPDGTKTLALRSGTVERVTYNDGTVHDTRAIGFFNDFKGSGVNAVQAVGSGVDVKAVDPSKITASTTKTAASDAIRDLSAYTATNPSGGVTLCIRSESSKQIAYVNIGTGAASGSGAGRLAITSRIQDGGTC